MKFNHFFYDSKVNFKAISKKRIVLSILLGLVSAFIIYNFFYAIRETERLMSLDFENRPIIISEESRNFFNLFFASISMVLGNSIAISFLFSRPQKIFSKRNNKRARILNDQAFLVPNFIYLFTKIWVLFGTLTFVFIGSKFEDYLFLPSVLLIIVLYFDSWKVLIHVIKKQRLKIQIIHLITFCILTFILSKVHLIDYKTFDESMLSANPTIAVPSSLYLKDNYQRYDYGDLVLKMDFGSNKEVGLFSEDNEPLEWSSLSKIVLDYNDEYSYNVCGVVVRLRANKDIPIRYIKEFEFILLQANQWRLVYEVSNADEFTARSYNNQLEKRISPSLYNVFPRKAKPPLPKFSDWDFYKDQKFRDTLSINISARIKIDNLEVPLNMLSRKIKNHIGSSSIVEYIYDDLVTYQDYINVLSAHKEAIWKLRATENFEEVIERIRHNQFSRNDSLNNERDTIMKKYPFRITERFE